ncbi:MAG: cupin domain-containing protein [Bacillota bacterium]
MEAIIRNQENIELTKHPKHRDVYMKILTNNSETGRLSASIVSIRPGGEILPHTHEVIEVFYIMKGIGSALVNGVRMKAEAGTIIIAPAGNEHGMINEGQEDLELYCVFSPGVV